MGNFGRKLQVAVVVVGLAATALVSQSVDAQGNPGNESSDGRSSQHDRDRGPGRIEGVGTIDWGECTDDTLIAFGAECGMLSVPLDWKRPRGEHIQLAVSRVAADPSVEYQGIMLVNPGGPGGSGLIYSILQFFVPNGAGAAYDWIGFDPRGVGSSVPSLSCDPTYFMPVRPPYDPTTDAIEQAWLTRSEQYADDCAAAGGDLLDHLTTLDNVRDMDAIRYALGESQLNYYGFSYGTYLGQVYATNYPRRVRRMVLDANVDPRNVWYQANLDQDVAFDHVFQLFLDWIASHDDVYGLGATNDEVEAAYYDALAQLAAAPQGDLGAAEWSDAFLVSGYAQFVWPDTASAFAAFVNDGDPGPMTGLFYAFNNTTDDNAYAIYLATECTDVAWPSRWRTWERDNTRLAATVPFLTWGNAWFNAPCLFWHADPARRAPLVNGREAPPILLLSETEDAATPFTGSLEVRKRFPRSSLIATEGGTTHANSLFGGNSCVDDQVAAYLADGTLPARVRGTGPDAVCEATPLPEPIAPAALVGASSGGSMARTLQAFQLQLQLTR